MSYTITYYADDASMGDTSPANCDAYRAWARRVLSAEYPDHEIEVCSQPAGKSCSTDDIDHEDEIHEFCQLLWDSCPWGDIQVAE